MQSFFNAILALILCEFANKSRLISPKLVTRYPE
jgi:putative Ca2+/H+ antiporter (TMEM165/GDT1 family)